MIHQKKKIALDNFQTAVFVKPSFCYFVMWQVNNCLSYHCSLLAPLDFWFVLSTLLSIASSFTTVEWIAKYPLKFHYFFL